MQSWEITPGARRGRLLTERSGIARMASSEIGKTYKVHAEDELLCACNLLFM